MSAARTNRAASAKHAPNAKRTPFLLLLGGLIIGGMCALLALNTASAANELQRHDYAATDQSVAAQVAALENEVALSGAPGNIAAAAARLGMVPAGNPAFLVIRPGGLVTVLGSPAPASGFPTYVPPTTSAAPSTSSKTSPKTSPTPTGKGSSHGRSTAPASSSSAPKSSPAKSSSPPAPPTPSGGTTLPGGDR